MRPKTIICDIDGTLVEHDLPIKVAKPDYKMKLLPGTLEKIMEWESKSYNIILLSGRRESLRTVTKKQLSKVGIVYDMLVMGVGGGDRYLINDCKSNGHQTAYVKCPGRNKGITDITI